MMWYRWSLTKVLERKGLIATPRPRNPQSSVTKALTLSRFTARRRNSDSSSEARSLVRIASVFISFPSVEIWFSSLVGRRMYCLLPHMDSAPSASTARQQKSTPILLICFPCASSISSSSMIWMTQGRKPWQRLSRNLRHTTSSLSSCHWKGRNKARMCLTSLQQATQPSYCMRLYASS